MSGRLAMLMRRLRAQWRPRRSIVRHDAVATLDRLVRSDVSLARFGDGELLYSLSGRGLRFQRWDRALAERLERALLGNDARVLRCFNFLFRDSRHVEWIVDLERYGQKPFIRTRTALRANDIGVLKRDRQSRAYRRYWRIIAAETAAAEYGEATVFFLGNYVKEYEAGEIDLVREKFRALFRGKRILFVAPDRPLGGPSFAELEPALLRIGMRSAQFLAIPRENAGAVIDEIAAGIAARTGFDEVFLQAGPVATVLAYELPTTLGIRALDVGSLNTQIRYLA